jgi:hypothetical protein
MSEVRYRWIDGPKISETEWLKEMERIDAIMAARGWMTLGQATSVIRVAEDAQGKLLGFLVLQLIPHTEPIWTAPAARGTSVAEHLISDMIRFMGEAQIRGFMVVADNPLVVSHCRAYGMKEVESPVFVRVS